MYDRSHSVSRHHRGFTLTELLVVMPIIAIPRAMLMPALQRVKRQAKRSPCLASVDAEP